VLIIHTPILYRINKPDHEKGINREELEGFARPGVPLRSEFASACERQVEIFDICQSSRANGANL
jgi:hypothetical protein